MDGGDQFVRVTRDHGKPAAARCALPEARHGELRLVCDLKPHLAFQRLSCAHLVRVGGPLAELGQRDQAAVLRALGEPAPLRQAELLHARYRPGQASAVARRRARSVAPVMPKPRSISAQVAGSGTAGVPPPPKTLIATLSKLRYLAK